MMDKVEFVTWLRGWIELNDGAMPTERQWEMIKDHLDLGFAKVTPNRGSPPIPPLKDSADIADMLRRAKGGEQVDPLHKYQPLYPYSHPYWLQDQLPSRDLIMC